MKPPSRTAALADALAAAYLAGDWSEPAMVERSRATLAPVPRWLPAVARDVLAAYPRAPADRPRELTAFVARALESHRRAIAARPPRVVRRLLPAAAMARRRWPVPELATPADLADWLGLDDGELEWFADVRSLERLVPDQRLRHYRYAWLARAGGRMRVIEQPKPRLKALQRRVLHELLVWIPVHDAAHGFVAGRSARTHAAQHVGRRVVVRLDLEDCFASVAAGRVYGIFRTAGYPEAVAHALTGLCTNTVPIDDWAAVPRPRDPRLITAHHRLGRRLATPHLPQGAPTSPALANLCAHRLDRRLAALATVFGARYTRYADDLVLSGGAHLHRRGEQVRERVGTIAREEGFTVNEGKSQLMTRAGCQRVAGIVVNERPNVGRGEYDRLKAILHDAVRHGPEAANRAGLPAFRDHLRGRIAWVEFLHPGRGARLRERFDAVAWD
jgi:hypothetical protein